MKAKEEAEMAMLRETNEKTFSEIYNDADTFYKESNAYGFTQEIDEDSTKKVFYLLTARYGDCVTTGYTNEARWKMKLFSILWEYGPQWVRIMSVRTSLNALTEDEAKKGTTVLVNHARNPQNKPTNEELEYVDDQNTTKYRKSRMEALELMDEAAKSNGTNEFLARFKVLFNPVLMPSDPLYVYGMEDNE